MNEVRTEAKAIADMELDPEEAGAALKYLLLGRLLDMLPNDSEKSEVIREFMDVYWYELGSLTDRVGRVRRHELSLKGFSDGTSAEESVKRP